MRKKTDSEFKRCRMSEDADYLESVQELKFKLSIIKALVELDPRFILRDHS